MGYRIQVDAEASTLLRTLSPSVVLRLGRAVADLVEALTSGRPLESPRLTVEGCALVLDVDHRAQVVRVLGVEPA